MDSIEYTKRRTLIFEYVKKGRYQEAAEEADQIDWNIVQNVKTIEKVSAIYLRCKRYEDSLRLMEIIYERDGSDLAVLKRLCAITAALGEREKVKKYYEEYRQLEKDPLERRIMRYRAEKALGVKQKELMEAVKAILKVQYISRWAYELARLYLKTGDRSSCIQECRRMLDELEEDEYTKKASELLDRLDWQERAEEEEAEPESAIEPEEEEAGLESVEEPEGEEAEMVLENAPAEDKNIVDELQEAEPEENDIRRSLNQMENRLASLSRTYETDRRHEVGKMDWADEVEDALRAIQ